jgi:predicted alpha/beta superfamily hydrolase
MEVNGPEIAAELHPPPIRVTSPGVTGDLELHEFRSRIFRNTRLLRVWLPPRYSAAENANRRYPVFYLNDGQNLFEPATSFTGVEWQADETADRLIRQELIPPLIVVGIDNAKDDRIKEYLPWRSLSPPVWRPMGKRYPDFLLEEVMPFIEERYPIAAEPQNTGLGGSSMGGLISLFTAIERPEVFGRVLIESPSLFISNRQALKLARRASAWPGKMFLAIGTNEVGQDEKNRRAVADVQQLAHILRKAGLGEDRLLVKIDEGATHSEGEWAKRLPDAMTFLFGKTLP